MTRLALMLALAVATLTGALAEPRVHGENSLFAGPTVRLAWAIRKGTSEETTQVIIRAVNVSGAYTHIRADGVDPFSQDRVVLAGPERFGARAAAPVDLAIARARLADHPSIELRLFADEAGLAANAPALTVFYLGVPDTAPEFAQGGEVERYLERMSATPR